MLNEYNLRRGLLQAAFVLSSLTLMGQVSHTYSGRVMQDGLGLADVEIILTENMQVLGQTDSLGSFSVSTTKPPKVQFRKQGYYTIQLQLKVEENLIHMVEKVNLLDQVVYAEGKTEKEIKRTTITLELIQPDLIEQTAPTNITQSINRINGVQIIDNQANIRSGSGWSYGAGSRVQVMVNGLPMLSGDAAQPQWSFIPTEGIERVEIIKGAASVIYGSSALNGVINIKTRTHSDEPETFLSLSTGIYDLPKREGLNYNNSQRNNKSNVSAFHVGKIGKLDFTLGLNMLHDEGYKMHDDEDRARTTIGLRKVNPKNNSILGLSAGIQMGNSSNFLLWESYEQGYTSLDSLNTENKTFRLSIDPYYSWTRGAANHKIISRYLKVSNAVDNGDPDNDQSNFSDLAYVEYQFNQSFGRDWSVLSGAVASLSQTRSPLFSGKQNTNNAAAYVQLEKSMFKNRLIVNGGGRLEYFRLNSRTEAKPVFRFGLNFEATKSTFIRFSMGQGYRFPSVAEAFITTSVGPVTIYPNTELRSETGSNIELGLKQGFKVKNVTGFIDLAYYQMNFNNMSEFLFDQWGPFIFPTEFGIGFKAINAGKTRISGFESSIALTASTKVGEFQGFMGYTLAEAVALEPDHVFANNYAGAELNYRNTSTTVDGKALKYRPKHSFKSDLMWSYKRLKLGYGIAYQSKFASIDTAFVGANIPDIVPGVDTAMSKALSSFELHNVRIGFEVYKELVFNVIVSNISNREYMIRPGDLGPPRSLRFQISYTFK